MVLLLKFGDTILRYPKTPFCVGGKFFGFFFRIIVSGTSTRPSVQNFRSVGPFFKNLLVTLIVVKRSLSIEWAPTSFSVEIFSFSPVSLIFWSLVAGCRILCKVQKIQKLDFWKGNLFFQWTTTLNYWWMGQGASRPRKTYRIVYQASSETGPGWSRDQVYFFLTKYRKISLPEANYST